MHLMQPYARVVLKNPNNNWRCISCDEDQNRDFSALYLFAPVCFDKVFRRQIQAAMRLDSAFAVNIMSLPYFALASSQAGFNRLFLSTVFSSIRFP